MNLTDLPTVLAIIAMGFAIYLTRIGGYWLAGRMRMNHRVEAWLNYLPGCIIISIIAPEFLHAKPTEIAASLVTIILMRLTNNLLVAMVAGIAVVAVTRLF